MAPQIFYEVGCVISQRKSDLSFFFPSNFRVIEWFRPDLNLYHDSYGPMTGYYYINRRILLLNLGSSKVRKSLVEMGVCHPIEVNPDHQYNHFNNLRLHEKILASSALSRFDGTICCTASIDVEDMDELSGPEEIVLFRDRVRNALTLILTVKDK